MRPLAAGLPRLHTLPAPDRSSPSPAVRKLIPSGAGTRLGLDRLHLVEIRRDADWPELWQAADLAVFPHQRPADGLDVLWALAVGTPAIVTAEGGLDWLAGSPAVRTIPGGDHELLAEAMVEALAGPCKATAGESAIAAATQQQGMAATAGKIAEAYRCVLTERFGQLPRE